MNALALGLLLGVGAGLAPGPLLALVVRSAVQDGFAAGARVAFSPLLTDAPIIVVAVAFGAVVPDRALGVLAVAGGAFVGWLGVQALRERPVPRDATATRPPAQRDVLRGALTNALSPHPWVFWMTVGAPVVGRGTAREAVLFVGAFSLVLVGTKVAVAAGVAAGRQRLLAGRGYAVVLRLSGLGLLAAGAVLLVDGLRTVA